MKMKKTWIPLLAAATVVMGAVPAAAVEVEQPTTDLTETITSGDTAVTASVQPVDAGDVTYVVSIPSRVDFGQLKRPAAGENPVIDMSAAVGLKQAENLEGKAIGVFVQDAAKGTQGFVLRGQDAANSDKELDYEIKLSETGAVLNTSNLTPQVNGFLVAAFKEAPQSVGLHFLLDQGQLSDGSDLAQWAGNYRGTITFYSKVGSENDFG